MRFIRNIILAPELLPSPRGAKSALARIWRGLFSPVLCCSLLSSCLPDPLEVNNVPKAEPQIVVSSQIIPDQSLVLLLTRTISALDASDDSDPQDLIDQVAVNDAIATVSGPGGTDTLLFFGNGVYGGISIPFAIGEVYTLKVTSESLGTVTASTEVKPQITFGEIQADLYYNGFDDTLAQITYSLVDPDEMNWYMLTVQEVEQEDAVENIINPRAHTKLLEDKGFNGKEFGEDFRVFPRDYKPGDTIAVSLANISEEYYRFMKLRIDNRFSFVEFLGEPVNYPTNVEGGRGFFNLYVPDVRFFVLEE
jgi:hypothetical protein